MFTFSDIGKEQVSNPAIKEIIRYREALWEGYRKIKESGIVDVDGFIAVFAR